MNDLKEQAQRAASMRELERSPQFSDDAPFDAVPDNGWLLCRRIHVTRTPKGIELPETAQFSHFQVLRVGLGQVTADGVRADVPYEPGDVVLVHGGAVAQIHEGISLFFVLQTWVLCKVTPRPAGN